MKIRLKPISKRGKDRINEHGDTFELIKEDVDKNKDHDGLPDRILVESLNNTCRGEKWLGWFELDKDVKIVSENPA